LLQLWASRPLARRGYTDDGDNTPQTGRLTVRKPASLGEDELGGDQRAWMGSEKVATGLIRGVAAVRCAEQYTGVHQVRSARRPRDQ
jgi:hypothetical protein